MSLASAEYAAGAGRLEQLAHSHGAVQHSSGCAAATSQLGVSKLIHQSIPTPQGVHRRRGCGQCGAAAPAPACAGHLGHRVHRQGGQWALGVCWRMHARAPCRNVWAVFRGLAPAGSGIVLEEPLSCTRLRAASAATRRNPTAATPALAAVEPRGGAHHRRQHQRGGAAQPGAAQRRCRPC